MADARPRDPDVTRRRVLAAGGLTATGLALTGSSALGASRKVAGVAPLQQTSATFVGLLVAEGAKLTGYGFITEAYGLGALSPAGAPDIPSRLALRLDSRALGQAVLGGVVIARSEGRLTLFEPKGKPSLEDPKSFRGGRTVAQADARLQSVIARGEGMATVTGDVIQRGSGRVSIGGSKPYGRDGLAMRLWATGPITATHFDESRWTHQIAGNLVVTAT